MLCRECAEQALRYSQPLDPFRQTRNVQQSEDILAAPDVIALLANERRTELSERTQPQAAAVNVDYDGDDVLPLLTTNWVEEARRQ